MLSSLLAADNRQLVQPQVVQTQLLSTAQACPCSPLPLTHNEAVTPLVMTASRPMAESRAAAWMKAMPVGTLRAKSWTGNIRSVRVRKTHLPPVEPKRNRTKTTIRPARHTKAAPAGMKPGLTVARPSDKRGVKPRIQSHDRGTSSFSIS